MLPGVHPSRNRGGTTDQGRGRVTGASKRKGDK